MRLPRAGTVADAAGEGGYARALTDAEQQAMQKELGEHVGRHGVVITTAQVPGRRPPLLVTEEAIKAMAPGSVVVDLAAGPLGGNVALSQPGRTIVTDNGVTIIGADSLPATMPTAASAAYSRNVSALLRLPDARRRARDRPHRRDPGRRPRHPWRRCRPPGDPPPADRRW